jgi:hypothetical protein
MNSLIGGKFMNSEIKAKWIDALESGEFAQAQGTLLHNFTERIGGEKIPPGYCCWGILCHVMGIPDDMIFRISYPAQKWLDDAGINGREGPTGDIVRYLAGMNDTGCNFPVIAEEIKVHL